MANKKLAVAIPTYNRHIILKENLLFMLPELEKYDVTIYISDDSDNYLTRDMISELKQQYNNIHYHKNNPSLGHDKNCLKTLSMPREEYIWYLGDSLIIKDGGIKDVLNIIGKETFDILLVNSETRDIVRDSEHYYDANKFFVDLAWHATFTGTTIYKKDILFRGDYQKYIDSNFIQLGIVLEELLESDHGLYWFNKKLIYTNKNKKGSYWNKEIFKVFAKDWVDFIKNLPDEYSCGNKKKVMKSHSNYSGIFKFRTYIALRRGNILSIKSYFKHYNELKLATSLNMYAVFFIALLPRPILVGLKYVQEKLKIN